MTTANLISQLQEQGVTLTVKDGKLQLKPKSNVKPEQVGQLIEHKIEIIRILQTRKKEIKAKGYGCAACGHKIYFAVEAWEMSENPASSPWQYEHKAVFNWQCEGCGTVFEIISGTTGPQNLN